MASSDVTVTPFLFLFWVITFFILVVLERTTITLLLLIPLTSKTAVAVLSFTTIPDSLPYK